MSINNPKLSVIGIPMLGPLLAGLFLYSLESEYIQQQISGAKKRTFHLTFHYIDDVLSMNNHKFRDL